MVLPSTILTRDEGVGLGVQPCSNVHLHVAITWIASSDNKIYSNMYFFCPVGSNSMTFYSDLFTLFSAARNQIKFCHRCNQGNYWESWLNLFTGQQTYTLYLNLKVLPEHVLILIEMVKIH